MSEYTPTTEEMRAFYTAERLDGPHLRGFPPPTVEQAESEFNAWLAAHDAEVRAGVVTEEPEWEYEVTYSSASAPSIDGYRMRRSSGILPSLAMVAEWMGFSQNAIAHRRTKAVPAGEWERVPVKQEGVETDG